MESKLLFFFKSRIKDSKYYMLTFYFKYDPTLNTLKKIMRSTYLG